MLRGVIIVLLFTWGVPLISLATFYAANAAQHGFLMNTSFGFVLAWVFLFLPHVAIVPQLYSSGTAVGLALGQWTLAGIVVGQLTRSMGHRRTLVVAIIAIAALALATHALLRGVGYQIVVEGP